MTVALIVVVVILAIAIAALALARERARLRPRATPTARTNRRILFPFVAEDLSDRALTAALRLAVVEGATLVPVFLARVSLDLPLDTPLPRQCSRGLPLLDVIEQRATEVGVPVDARIERGRTPRHALRQAIAQERFDRIVISAASHGSHGFNADDVAWLLDNAKGEIVVLRPSDEDQVEIGNPAASTPARPTPGPVRAEPAPPHPKSVALRLPRGSRRSDTVSRAGETAVSR